MFKFTNYTYACAHSAISYPFCANPCSRYISFADQGLRTFRDSECPYTCLEENVLSFACEDCKDLPHFRNLPDPATAPVPTFEGVWHIPEGAAHVEHLRTTYPWADDRRGDTNVETERPQRERHDEQSESPKGRSGSGVTTDQRTARDGADMRTVLRNLGAGLSEMQITDLIVKHPQENARMPGHISQSPSPRAEVMSTSR